MTRVESGVHIPAGNANENCTEPMLTERDLVGVLGKSHKSSQPVNSSTPMATVFGQNKSCVLTPEITEGPYCT